MLVHDPEKGTVSSQALTSGSAPKVLLRETKDYGQIAVSPDGRKIAATVNKFGNPGTSQLITVELAGGAVTPLTKESGWADVQWPQWSPSGKQIAWQLRVGEKEGMPQSTVVVNGKNLTKPAMTGTHQWLTEKALVVTELEAIVIVDAESGKELGRKPTGAKSK
jgi:Tol biopolymer transport system component